jgi:hypothetical protein
MRTIIASGMALGMGLLLAAGAAHAQYISDFEALDASAAGVPLAGQEGFYIPPATTSSDFFAYSYLDNPLGLPVNPEGGRTFVAGAGPGGGTFARAQRDFAFTGLLKRISFDIAVPSFGGTLPATDYIGSFSFQPVDSAQFIALMSWTDLAVADTYRVGFVVFDEAGTQVPLPGAVAGPEWENLQPDTWYRVEIVGEWRERRIRRVELTELDTAVSTSDVPADWYFNGGALGTSALPESFRFFGGGGQVGNAVAFDNFTFTCYVDCNGDDQRDIFDFLCFQNAFDQGDPYADCDGDGELTLFDFLCFQNAFVCD